MIISPLELELLAGNSALGESIRKSLGVALHTAIYNPESEYGDKYARLGDPEAYDCPDDEMLLLCTDFL